MSDELYLRYAARKAKRDRWIAKIGGAVLFVLVVVSATLLGVFASAMRYRADRAAHEWLFGK